MARTIALYVFLLLTNLVICQGYTTPLTNNELQAVQSKSNTLYLGIDNRVLIQLDTSELYTLTSNNGSCFRDSLNYYIIPAKPGRARVHVYTECDSGKTLVGYKTFRVKSIPNPLIFIDTVCLDNIMFISRDVLCNGHTFYVSMGDDIIQDDNWFSINKIIISYVSKGQYISHENLGNRLTMESIELIRQFGMGKKIMLRFQLKGTGGITRLDYLQYDITLL